MARLRSIQELLVDTALAPPLWMPHADDARIVHLDRAGADGH